MSDAFGLFSLLVALWMTPPLAMLAYFAGRYGYNATVEITIYFGPHAPMLVSVKSKWFYWGPVGMLGVEAQMQ